MVTREDLVQTLLAEAKKAFTVSGQYATRGRKLAEAAQEFCEHEFEPSMSGPAGKRATFCKICNFHKEIEE